VPIPPSFWKWLANAAGALLVEVVIALVFDDDKKTKEE
jgi:hypothetical protein